MTWLRTDDGFPEHPKCDALAAHFGDDWATLNLAFALWHHMGCDCASRRTDGAFDSARAYRVMRAPREVVDKALAGLVKVRLLERKRDGFLFHDWVEYQPTKAQLDAERAQKTARQARWRAGKAGEVDAAETQPKTAGRRRVDGAVDASTSRLGDGAVEGAPSRPDPSRPDREEGSAPARAEPTPSAHGPATTPTGRSLLDAFRDAAGSRATLVGNMSEERGLARMLDRLAPSTAEVQAMADALGSPAAWWPPGKRAAPKHVTLRDLAGWKEADGEPGWAPLSALIAHVRAKAASDAARVSPSGLPEWKPTPVKIPGLKSTVKGA
jgi:hypothetical protein